MYHMHPYPGATQILQNEPAYVPTTAKLYCYDQSKSRWESLAFLQIVDVVEKYKANMAFNFMNPRWPLEKAAVAYQLGLLWI